MTNTAYQHLQTKIFRGGRLVKWKGVVASISPIISGGVIFEPFRAPTQNLRSIVARNFDQLGPILGSGLSHSTASGPLILTLAVFSLAVNLGTSVQAQSICTETAPGIFQCSDQGIPIDSTNSQEFSGGGFITIGPDVVISSGSSALWMRDSATYIIRVTEDAKLDGAQGIQLLDSSSFTLINDGEITGRLRGVGNDSFGSAVGLYSITNNGTITGPSFGDPSNGREALRVFGNMLRTDVYVENSETGRLIAPVRHALSAQGVTGTFINNGSIEAGQDGMYLSVRRDASVTVGSEGSIEAGRYGISFSADDGARTANYTGEQNISIAGDVYGEIYGLVVGRQIDPVTMKVKISGKVSSGTGGPRLQNQVNAAIGVGFHEFGSSGFYGGINIEIDTDGEVSAATGLAIHDFANPRPQGWFNIPLSPDEGASNVTVRGRLFGDVVLTYGSDTVSIEDGAILGDTGRTLGGNGILLDGDNFSSIPNVLEGNGSPMFVAGDVDELSFDGWSGNRNTSAETNPTETDIDLGQIVNFERVLLRRNADVTFGNRLRPSSSFGSNNPVDGFLFEVEDGSIARFAESLIIDGNVNNFGALDLSAPNLTVGTALTITGNYAAASDLFLDVFLNDGGPDNVAANDAFFTDQVFIAGNVSGVTHVFVNNLGGAGAITDLNRNGLVDANEGILIVQVAGATPLDTMTDSVALAEHFVLGSAANTFVSTLTNRTNVSVGAFAYDIYAIGADATGNVNGTMDYVLANTLNFSPVSPVYEAYPSFLLDQIGMPRLQERVGNRHWARPAAEPQVAAAEPVYVFCKDPAQNFRCAVTPEQAQVYADPIFGSVGTDTATVIEGQGLWLRADGALSRYTPVASTIGAGYKAHSAGIQVGYDHVLMETETGGRLIGGVNVSYRTSGADVTSGVGLGEIATAGYGLGASLTWYAENGFYIDAQAQAVWLDSDLSADGLGQFAAGHKTEGYGVSVEMGKEIALSDTWAITPQAQVSYANVQENGVTDSLGSMVSFKAESLKLRVGVELSNEKTWEAEDGTTSRRSLRAGAHVIHEFKPETKVMVAGTPLLSKRDATTAEITLGGTYNWSDDRNSFYAQIGASTGLGNFGDSHRVRGTVGFRRQWE